MADQTAPMAEGPIVGFLTFRIARLHLALNAQAVALLEEASGITLGQWRMLSLVAAGEAKTSRDLAKIFGFDPAFISRTIAGMEKAGMIASRRAPTDRRMLELEVTKKGEGIYRDTLPIMRRRQAALMEALAPEEQAMIVGMLDKLEAAAAERDFLG